MVKVKTAYISQPYGFNFPLSQRNFYQQEKKVLKRFNLERFLEKKIYHYKWREFEKRQEDSRPIEERILSILENKKLSLKPKSNLNRSNFRSKSIKRLNYFISRQRPIIFTITQVAFKMPNPLKTSRIAPDLGELAFLSQLYDITKIIKKIYNPGAKIVIFGESYIFRKIVGVTYKEAGLYFKTIGKWIHQLGWKNNLVLYDLRFLEKQVINFSKEFKKNLESLKSGFKAGVPETVEEIKSTASTQFLCVNTRNYSLKMLMDIFVPGQVDPESEFKLPPKIQKIRSDLHRKAVRASIPYLAYHKSIISSRLPDKLFPNSLKLSFTPGPKKICLKTICSKNKLYPYHGVPLLLNKGHVKIIYKIDLLRTKNVKAYFINNEKEPFFYCLKPL